MKVYGGERSNAITIVNSPRKNPLDEMEKKAHSGNRAFPLPTSRVAPKLPGMTTVVLKSGRDHTLLRRHPWIFSGAVDRLDGESPASGETVMMQSASGETLGFGAWSPTSQIRVRMWSFDTSRAIDGSFFEERLASAFDARAALPPERRDTNALRMVNAEADGLPGLVVDQYGDFLVCQFAAAGVEHWKQEIVQALTRIHPCAGIYDRSDLDVRKREGLEDATGVLAGEQPPEQVEIREGSCRYGVDVLHGHKTGFYLDQRDNRAIVASYASGRDVLNAFSYTGGFGVAAARAGAKHVTHMDLSGPSLSLARANVERNGLDVGASEFVEGNVFEVLRGFRDRRKSFDLIVLDPPKFVDSKGHLMAACRGYKDINLLGLKLLRPGGILATFSCSGLLPQELFQKIVSDAVVDAHRNVQVLQRLGAAPDHAESLTFPEGAYLKGLLCRVE